MVFYTFSLHKGCPRKLHLAQSGGATQFLIQIYLKLGMKILSDGLILGAQKRYIMKLDNLMVR